MSGTGSVLPTDGKEWLERAEAWVGAADQHQEGPRFFGLEKKLPHVMPGHWPH